MLDLLKSRIPVLLADFRFWLIATVIQRLFFITVAPLEVGHNWRQSTVCMVARNFLEIDANLFFPRVDMAGELTGITGMEFPLLNYLIYLVSLIFGYDHWYGRLINLLVTAAGQWAFFVYLKKLFNPQLAFRVSMVLLFSIFYMYSRKIMPDTFSMALCMAGMLALLRFSETWKWQWWMASALAIAFGALSKLPAILVLPFLLPLLQREDWDKRVLIGAALVPGALLSAVWYFYWAPHITDAFGYQHFFSGAPVLETISYISQHVPETLKMFYQHPIGISGFVLFLIGIVQLFRGADSARWALAITGFLFLCFMSQTGFNFYQHEYYIVPIVPAMAYLAAKGMTLFPSRWALLLIAIVCVEGLATRWSDQFIKRGAEIEMLESMIDEEVAPDQLIAINGGVWPTALYFSHRKGWIAYNEELSNLGFVSGLQARGCQFILVMKVRFGEDLQLPYEQVKDTPLFRLYKLP